MKQHLEIIGLFLVLSIFCCNKVVNAEVNEFSQKVNGDIYGQVKVIDDVDGDGNKDLIFGATDGKIHLFSSKGDEIFRPPYWPKQVDSPITAGIEVSDLDGQGNINILASTMSGTVYCLNAKGKELWKYNTGGSILVSTPLVVDMEGNGKQEIILNSSSGRVVLLASNGEEMMATNFDHAVQSSPVAVDVDGDGEKDIIVKDSGGKITIVGKDTEWFASNYNTGMWSFGFDAADIDGDGIPEIFSTDPEGGAGIFQMWDPEGNLLTKFPLTDAAHGAPKVADIDCDGIDDFIIAQADGNLVVCEKNGSIKKGFPYSMPGYSIYSTPTIIDIDGDGFPEIVYTANNSSCTDERAGCIIALDATGKLVKDYPKYIGRTMAPLTFADLDGDGNLEIIAAGGIGYTAPQLHVIKTETKRKFKIVTLRQQTTVK